MYASRIGLLLLLMSAVLLAQGMDVTGRVSLRVFNVDYDETSELNPDSANYGKTTLVPGLQQYLNMAVFARTSKLDISLLGDIRNDKWTPLDSYKRVERLTLSARFSGNEIVLGDFFESSSELYLFSRDVRGAKLDFVFEDLWNRYAYLQTRVVGGIVQKAVKEGEALPTLYKQYVNSALYERYFGSAQVELGERDKFSIGLNYLYAKDDPNSITESVNSPLLNQNAGLNAALYFWDQHIKLFAEGYASKKDTINADKAEDYAYKAGLDLRFNKVKLQAFYQRLGYDYYTAGNPFLLNDWQGVKLLGAVEVVQGLTFDVEGQQYSNNLKKFDYLPTTKTRIAGVGLNTNFRRWPDLSLRWRFQDDLSNDIYDEDNNLTRTDKISRTFDATVGYASGNNRISLSGIYVNLDDNSLVFGDSTQATEQVVFSLNFYTRPSNLLFISGGAVYSTLRMTGGEQSKNLVLYESSRWDIIPMKLKFETTLNYILNKADGGKGYNDLLNNYNQLALEVALEYFFTPNISLKVLGGSDGRRMDYTKEQALKVIGDPDYGPMYFNGYETYNGIKYGAEINWIF